MTVPSQSPESAPIPMSNVCICGVPGPFKEHSFTCPAYVGPDPAPIPSEGKAGYCQCGHHAGSHSSLRFNCMATHDGTHATRCACRAFTPETQ